MKFTIAPYSLTWPALFEEQAAVIRTAIGQLRPLIDHIGSTSVPGLAAKPIIDILVGVRHEGDLEKVAGPMQQAGYTYFPLYEADMPYRRYFAKLRPLGSGQPPAAVTEGAAFNRADFDSTVHIHIIPKDSPHWLRHIAFRDYLRAHADAREAYADIKRTIAQRDFRDMIGYNDAKDAFVKDMERKAVAWYHRR